MVMVSARSTLRVLARSHRGAAAIFNAADADLLPDLTRTEQFITAAAAALRPDSHLVDVVNAGHLDTLWFHADRGEVERLPSTSTIFGFASGDRHRNRKVNMEPGDVLLLYTDGVVEAVNSEDEMFGDDRLCAVVMENASERAQGILGAVFAAVEDFVNRHRFQDDITAVVIKALA
jgi:sigma-B regulation protein RsbU (phosphoserine phosphatase)